MSEAKGPGPYVTICPAGVTGNRDPLNYRTVHYRPLCAGRAPDGRCNLAGSSLFQTQDQTTKHIPSGEEIFNEEIRRTGHIQSLCMGMDTFIDDPQDPHS